MVRLQHMLSWCVTAALLAVATPAWACPYCVGTEDDGIATGLLIVAMVSVPFLIVGVTGFLIHRANTSQALPGHQEREVC